VRQVYGVEEREIYHGAPGIARGVAKEDRVIKTSYDCFELTLGLARRTEAPQSEEALSKDYFGIDASLQQELNARHPLLNRVRVHVHDDRVGAVFFNHPCEGERANRAGKLGYLDNGSFAVQRLLQVIEV
jgi:hypothetical protein